MQPTEVTDIGGDRQTTAPSEPADQAATGQAGPVVADQDNLTPEQAMLARQMDAVYRAVSPPGTQAEREPPRAPQGVQEVREPTVAQQPQQVQETQQPQQPQGV